MEKIIILLITIIINLFTTYSFGQWTAPQAKQPMYLLPPGSSFRVSLSQEDYELLKRFIMNNEGEKGTGRPILVAYSDNQGYNQDGSLRGTFGWGTSMEGIRIGDIVSEELCLKLFDIRLQQVILWLEEVMNKNNIPFDWNYRPIGLIVMIDMVYFGGKTNFENSEFFQKVRKIRRDHFDEDWRFSIQSMRNFKMNSLDYNPEKQQGLINRNNLHVREALNGDYF